MNVPPNVSAAMANATASGFELSCDNSVGRLLGVLAATVRPDGRILELGTGTGVGLSWIVDGLGLRTDVGVTSVEIDPDHAAAAAHLAWPQFVDLHVGDALDFIDEPGQWDLIFADAQGGKWERLDDTIEALRPGGLLVVDDMTPPEFVNEAHRDKTAEVRSILLASELLVSVEIGWATGLILCTRRHR